MLSKIASSLPRVVLYQLNDLKRNQCSLGVARALELDIMYSLLHNGRVLKDTTIGFVAIKANCTS